jgi:hypothetical protein
LRYDFSQACERLLPVEEVVEERWFLEEWEPLVILGSSDYADGGGATPFLTIDRSTGAVMGLDVERADERAYLINSSVPRFIATFTYLDSFLARGQHLPGDAGAVVRGIDAAAYASEWGRLIEHLSSSDGLGA